MTHEKQEVSPQSFHSWCHDFQTVKANAAKVTALKACTLLLCFFFTRTTGPSLPNDDTLVTTVREFLERLRRRVSGRYFEQGSPNQLSRYKEPRKAEEKPKGRRNNGRSLNAMPEKKVQSKLSQLFTWRTA